jgi:peptide/nickel transport system substrate-binding protein
VVAPTEEVEMIVNAVGKQVEKPRYGGTIRIAIPSPTSGFDRSIVGGGVHQQHLTHEQGVEGDWRLSKAGTGQLLFQSGEQSVTNYETMIGCLTSEWLDWPDPQTAIFHINQEAHWPNIAPMNGRPVTAEDVAFSIDRWFYLPTAPGALAWPDVERRPQNIEVIDEYTLKWTNPHFRDKLTMSNTTWVIVQPKDAVELYGDQNDWRNSVGSAPFLITDVVAGSSITFSGKDDYWMNHPLYPDMTMPFVDEVEMLVIEDASTRMAALRTGKIDVLFKVSLDDWEQVMTTNPEMQYVQYLPLGWPHIVMRLDKPELPWFDKNVRHALKMAINRQEIIQDLYKGQAAIFEYPVRSEGTFAKMYVPIEDLPPATQELFEYKPDKARQLLADAGYADGFKAKVVARNKDVDILSIIQSYWSDIGVDMEIDIKETAVHRSIQLGRSADEMITFDWSGRNVQVMDMWDPGGYQNASYLEKTDVAHIVEEHVDSVLVNFSDHDLLGELYHEFVPFLVDLSHAISPPGPYNFVIWQPWLRDYNGEYTVGQWNAFEFPKYIWIDQDMKEDMTGSR